jgi:hypothetical protein
MRHNVHFDVDPGFGGIFFQDGHGILLPDALGIAHVAGHLDAIGVAGLGQQLFGHGNILLERLQFKIFGMNRGDMVVLRHNPQSAMGDIKLSPGITGQLHGPCGRVGR